MKRITLFLLFFLICNPLFAEDPQSYPQQGQIVFKGLDTKSSPTQIQDGRAQDLQNVTLSTTLALKKRNGYSLVNALLDDIHGAFAAISGLYYTRLSNGTDYTLAVEGDKLFYDASGTWTEITGVTITAGQDNQFVWTTALDNIVFTNDVNSIFNWGGSGNASTLDLVDLGSDAPTKAKCIAWFQNFLILGNTLENAVEKPTRIRWSNIGTIETWTEADRNDISELGGQEIEAFGLLYNDLIVFLTDSVWRMSFVGGDKQFEFIKVIDGIGCVAKNSVQNILLRNSQQGLCFLSKDAKIYFFNGITFQYISEVIEPTMLSLNQGRLMYAVSLNTGSEYRVFATSGGASINDKVIVFNYDMGEWTIRDQEDANAAVIVRDSDNDRFSYIGNYDSCVFKIDDTSLNDDIQGKTGVLTGVEVGSYSTATASGLTIIYDSSATFNTTTGATVKITGGTSKGGEKVVVGATTTGLVVDSDFTTTPDTTSTYSVGIIDTFYETKEYDFGDPARLKSYGEIFMWLKEQGSGDFTVSYKKDFASVVETQTVSQSGEGALWGNGIWGTAMWGGFEALLERIKLKGEGRYISAKIKENDAGETFEIYGYNFLFFPRRNW